MKKINIIITFALVFTLIGCATYEPQYGDEYTLNEIPTSNKEIDNRFFLIGDVGFSATGNSDNVLKAFKTQLEENNDENSYAIFLGNSFFPKGMSSKENAEMTLTNQNIEQQLNALKDFKGNVIFLPGNLDWYGSVDGLELEEDLLKDRYDGKDILQPNNGCPIESIEIGNDIQLIIVDSQWYIEKWDNHPKMNDKCEIKTREKLITEIEGELKKNKNKTILFAMHHPLITYGPYGGQYPAIHQNIIGSFYPQILIQGAISPQDRYNERYHELMTRLNVLAKDHDRLVFISGHDRSLQYNEDKNTKQIISGAGGRPTAVKLGQFGEFGYGGHGFAVLDVYKDGSSGVKFYQAKEDGTAKELFQKEVIAPEVEYDTSGLSDTFPETIKASVYEEDRIEKTGFYKTVWGDHYREIYGTKVTAKIAMLDTLYGGLKVARAGGGHQTRSLRLIDKDGKDYNMRALKKSAVQYLQTVIFNDKEIEDGFRETIPEDLVLDFYTAAHPYGAFTVAKLADAANVFHTNPKLYYIPKQKALGKFNEDYGDELYMIVERPDEPYDGAIFNYADDIESTDDLRDKIRSDEENIVDEKTYIRARIFDMLLGDWDRHTDQWRWAEFKNQDGKDVFVPIPRDRDQVYANFDGGLLDIVRSLLSSSRQLQVYDKDLKHTKWFNAAGIKLDRALIENSGKDEWVAQANFLKENVTNEVIEAAFNDLPVEAKDATAMDIKEKLKGRRDNIVSIAEDYYNYFSKLQVVTGTDKDDHFIITRLPNGETNIKAFRIKDGEKGELMVDRSYFNNETRELWVYGLDDDDIFEVKGNGEKPVFIRIIGGQNNDTYKIANGKKIKVYDHKSKKNSIEEKGGATFRLTDNYDFNTYDFSKQIKSTNLLLPTLGFNPDDGLKIGVSNVYTLNGFQSNPFAQQHRVAAGYYLGTQSFEISYEGEFANIFRDWNFLAGAHFKNPNYAVNFFGFGNETINPEEVDSNLFEREYNQVRIGSYGAKVGITKDSPYGSVFRFTAQYEAIKVDDTDGRYISVNPVTQLDESKSYLTVEGTYKYESYDNRVNPTRGMDFTLTAGGTQNIDDSDRVFGYIKPKVIFYNAITKNRKVVLKTTTQGQFNIGNDFEFYQAANAGAETGLRGYRNERFTGKSAAIGSADLRYSFNRFRTGLTPIQIGVFGGYDIGRVWLPNDTSEVWHSDFGGGFWINAADIIGGTFNLFSSEEGLRFTFGVAVSM
tara:strand:+ start:48343 stop:52023 length:3681 start_codon:yes stop_codon:yes gene_type:complete